MNWFINKTTSKTDIICKVSTFCTREETRKYTAKKATIIYAHISIYIILMYFSKKLLKVRKSLNSLNWISHCRASNISNCGMMDFIHYNDVFMSFRLLLTFDYTRYTTRPFKIQSFNKMCAWTILLSSLWETKSLIIYSESTDYFRTNELWARAYYTTSTIKLISQSVNECVAFRLITKLLWWLIKNFMAKIRVWPTPTLMFLLRFKLKL